MLTDMCILKVASISTGHDIFRNDRLKGKHEKAQKTSKKSRGELYHVLGCSNISAFNKYILPRSFWHKYFILIRQIENP